MVEANAKPTNLTLKNVDESSSSSKNGELSSSHNIPDKVSEMIGSDIADVLFERAGLQDKKVGYQLTQKFNSFFLKLL